MGSVNKVILVGNLGRDAEVRYTPGGAAVASFSMATTEVWNDKEGQRQEQTEWHRISLWGKQAESLTQYLVKGKQVYVEGRLQTRKWQDKEGHDRTPPRSRPTGWCCSAAAPGGGARGGARRVLPRSRGRRPGRHAGRRRHAVLTELRMENGRSDDVERRIEKAPETSSGPISQFVNSSILHSQI